VWVAGGAEFPATSLSAYLIEGAFYLITGAIVGLIYGKYS
jgi:hypothetical protein